MPALDRLYTWKLTDTELERLEPAERYAVELVAAIEPHVRAYLTASIHDPDERREAIADSVAEAFGAVGPKSTIESTRAAALRRARETSKECKARERYVDGRACVDTMSLSARDRDAVADCRYRLELWTWIEPRSRYFAMGSASHSSHMWQAIGPTRRLRRSWRAPCRPCES